MNFTPRQWKQLVQLVGSFKCNSVSFVSKSQTVYIHSDTGKERFKWNSLNDSWELIA